MSSLPQNSNADTAVASDHTLSTLLGPSRFATLTTATDVARVLDVLRPAVRVDAEGGAFYSFPSPLLHRKQRTQPLTVPVHSVGVLAADWAAPTYFRI